MRPVALRVKGFTAFRDEQVLDFEELDLFAIWGATGSGKSSLLDAITYALFGRVERVGREVKQLISQGQPRLAATLDFDVDGRRYRITRSTPRTGTTTKVMLERREGDAWVSYGEGADRVTGVKELVPRLIGLDYEAFTRSVLLPQGQFAEFLIGEAEDRRKILTELLGLELFGRMGERARQVSREAKSRREALVDVVQREYAGVDADAVSAAVRAAEDARARADAAEQAEEAVRDIAARWDRDAGSLAAIRSAADDVRAVLSVLREQADALAALREETDAAEAGRAEAAAEVDRLSGVVEAATSTRSDAEAEWGALDALIEAQQVARDLGRMRAEETTLASELDAAAAARAEAEERLAAVATEAEAAVAQLEGAQRGLAEARARHEEAHRADLVGALVADLEAGAPCPVCEQPLATIPGVGADALVEARSALEEAEAALRAADRTGNEILAERKLATEAVDRAAEQLVRLEARRGERTGEVQQLESSIATLFSEGVPGDPLEELRRRIERMRALQTEERTATEALRAAEDALRASERVTDAVGAERKAIAAAIANAGVARAADRARDALQAADAARLLPARLPADTEKLEAVAREAVAGAAELEASLLERESTIESTRLRLVDEAREALPDGVEAPGADPPAILQSLRAACRRLDERRAVAVTEAEALAERLANRQELERQADELRSEQEVYGALGAELKGDRLVAFLQEEALTVLAFTGTLRLEYLSQGRYRLEFDRDRSEFFVVDVWNGDERRSVRTLSGGETFLASLALALALSDQVRNLSVTERARLDSLFLDEGFGSLDADTLETVVGAIEQLGGDGRMVGVITHVWELAERMPVRIDVEKSPRGSTVRRVSAG